MRLINMRDIRPCCEDQNYNCYKHNSFSEAKEKIKKLYVESHFEIEKGIVEDKIIGQWEF